MSKYIEIDTALLKTVATGGVSAKALWKRITQQPSIDIVHCKDCRHWNGKYCFNGSASVPKAPKEKDFCSWGERTGNE